MSTGLLPEEILELLAFGDVEQTVEPGEFFDPAFMREHTQFETFAAFRAESPWDADEPGDVEDVPTDELDAYVARTTEFETWLAMRNEAAERAVIDRLML